MKSFNEFIIEASKSEGGIDFGKEIKAATDSFSLKKKYQKKFGLSAIKFDIQKTEKFSGSIIGIRNPDAIFDRYYLQFKPVVSDPEIFKYHDSMKVKYLVVYIKSETEDSAIIDDSDLSRIKLAGERDIKKLQKSILQSMENWLKSQ